MRKIVVSVVALVVIAVAVMLLWPRQKNGLVLYSGLDYGPAIGKAFTKATGIPVHVVRLSTGGLLARITAEGGHPDWALAWFDGATAAVALDQAGLLAHHLASPADLTTAGRAMVPGDGAYVPTGFTLAGVLIAARNADFPLPVRWSDLTRPVYRGLVGMNDPSISGPTYPALAGLLKGAGGWPQGKSFVEALHANGLHIYAKNDATLAALRSGVIRLALVQSSAAINDATNMDRALHVIYPQPSYVLPSVIVMAKGLHGRRRQDAARFIAYVNSLAAQAIRMRDGGGDGFYWPVTGAPAPRKALPALATLDLGTLDAARWGERENAIVGWFARRIIGNGT